MSAKLVCIILAIIVCLVLLWLVFLFTKRKRKVREDAEKEGQGITGQEEKKRRRKKTMPPTPPTPSSCPAAPCNTPNIRKKRTRKKTKTENNPKTKVVRFASQEKDVLDETPDFTPNGRKPYWSTDVEVTHLEFSEQNYRRNKITDSLFAGSVHVGYSFEETEKDGSCEEQVSEFTSWRELFDKKMENSV